MTNAELKAAIQAAIYENTEGAITGDALQGILLNVVDSLATPSIDIESLTIPYSGAGTPAEIAAVLGISEAAVNRIMAGECSTVSSYQKNSGGQTSYLKSAPIETSSTGEIAIQLLFGNTALLKQNLDGSIYLQIYSS